MESSERLPEVQLEEGLEAWQTLQAQVSQVVSFLMLQRLEATLDQPWAAGVESLTVQSGMLTRNPLKVKRNQQRKKRRRNSLNQER